MIRNALLALLLAAFSAAVVAQPTDPCDGLAGTALGQCRDAQQKLQQQQLQQLQQQFQQQQERQKQLDESQRQIKEQLESMRLQNEALRLQLEHEKSKSPAEQRPDDVKTTELKSWRSDNPWYGTDYARTEFAMRYAKQLRQEQPNLTGRAFFDAISAKVKENFGAK